MAYRRAQKRALEHTPITQNTPLVKPELDAMTKAINELGQAAALANKIQRQLELKGSVANLYAVSKPRAKQNTYVNDMVFLPIVYSEERNISDVFAIGGEAMFTDGLLTSSSQGDYTLVATYALGRADNVNVIKLKANDIFLQAIATSVNNIEWQSPSYSYYTDAQLHRNPLYQMIDDNTYIVLPNSTARYVRLTFRQRAGEPIEVRATFAKQHYEAEGEITFRPIPMRKVSQGKIHLLVDYLIPTSFDDEIEYVQFHVSTDGEQFVRCRANVEDGYHGVQINPAHPLLTSKSSLQLGLSAEGVSKPDDAVNEIFIKCYLTRPAEEAYSTPLIRRVIPYVE